MKIAGTWYAWVGFTEKEIAQEILFTDEGSGRHVVGEVNVGVGFIL